MKYTLEQTIGVEARALISTIQANFFIFILNMLLYFEALIFLYMLDPMLAGIVLFGGVCMIMLLVLLQRLSVKKVFGKKGTVVYTYSITPEQIEMAIGDALTVKYERADVKWSKETKTGLFIKHKRMTLIMLYKGEYKDAIRNALVEFGWVKKRKTHVSRILGIAAYCLVIVLLGIAIARWPEYLASIQ